MIIKENVTAVVRQMLIDRQRPRDIGAPVADKNGFFHALHGGS
jgi:hypothetical protein